MNRTGQPAVRLDHVALFTGALLAVRERWQPVLDTLPVGEVLVLLPPAERPVRPTLLLVGAFLQAMGHHVTQLDATRFLTTPPPGTQARLLERTTGAAGGVRGDGAELSHPRRPPGPRRRYGVHGGNAQPPRRPPAPPAPPERELGAPPGTGHRREEDP